MPTGRFASLHVTVQPVGWQGGRRGEVDEEGIGGRRSDGRGRTEDQEEVKDEEEAMEDEMLAMDRSLAGNTERGGQLGKECRGVSSDEQTLSVSTCTFLRRENVGHVQHADRDRYFDGAISRNLRGNKKYGGNIVTFSEHNCARSILPIYW